MEYWIKRDCFNYKYLSKDNDFLNSKALGKFVSEIILQMELGKF